MGNGERVSKIERTRERRRRRKCGNERERERERRRNPTPDTMLPSPVGTNTASGAANTLCVSKQSSDV